MIYITHNECKIQYIQSDYMLYNAYSTHERLSNSRNPYREESKGQNHFDLSYR